MRKQTQKLIYCLIGGLLPIALFGDAAGPPIPRAGVPGDRNGQNCSSCHRTFGDANTEPAGSVKIEAATYKPGIPQIIKVTVQHPEAQRWGFQLTARLKGDDQKMAGSFTVDLNIQVKCSPDGHASPCNGATEFAEHREISTYGGSNGSKTFEIEWNPPASEVGDVVFYAAGNAANGSGRDRIYTTTLTVAAGGACTLTKKPALQRVVDAAAGKPGLAMNSLLSLYGNDFQVAGSSRLAGAGDFVGGNFPKQLGCIAVEVAGKRVPVTYVQSDQINAQIPTLTQTGTVDVRVFANPGQDNELRSDVGTISLQNYAPQLFVFPTTTSVAALIAGTPILIPVANPGVVAGGRPAKPGEIISLFGTGFGPTDPVYQAGELASDKVLAPIRDPITISVGGTALAASDVLFAGAAPRLISGLYQINIRIPAATADGDIPVSVQIGGITSATGTTIPVKR